MPWRSATGSRLSEKWNGGASRRSGDLNRIARRLLVAAAKHCDELLTAEGKVNLPEAARLLLSEAGQEQVEHTFATLSRLSRMVAEIARYAARANG